MCTIKCPKGTKTPKMIDESCLVQERRRRHPPPTASTSPIPLRHRAPWLSLLLCNISMSPCFDVDPGTSIVSIAAVLSMLNCAQIIIRAARGDIFPEWSHQTCASGRFPFQWKMIERETWLDNRYYYYYYHKAMASMALLPSYSRGNILGSNTN